MSQRGRTQHSDAVFGSNLMYSVISFHLLDVKVKQNSRTEILNALKYFILSVLFKERSKSNGG